MAGLLKVKASKSGSSQGYSHNYDDITCRRTFEISLLSFSNQFRKKIMGGGALLVAMLLSG